MKAQIFECALGDISIEETCSGIRLWFSNGHMTGKQFLKDMRLPGGKFTAQEFLELFLHKWKRYQECGGQGSPMNSMDLGTWHFTPEAVDMAKRALDEWSER